jgi:hypothetical protein
MANGYVTEIRNRRSNPEITMPHAVPTNFQHHIFER